MTVRTIAIAAAALVFALPGTAQANHHGGNGQSGQSQASHAGHGQHGAKAKPKRAKACPPGLANKNPGCLPPGQWRKGDVLPVSWVARYVVYAALPDFYRSRYQVKRGYRYIYQDGRVIVVEALTRAVVDIVLR